jgi:CRISPR-associated protein Cas6
MPGTSTNRREAAMIDLVFPLVGRTLPRDHREALANALSLRAPGWADSSGAGLHDVNVVAGTASHALLSQRARLMLRVRREQLDSLVLLEDARLDVEGHALRLGRASVRELLPHTTLYAHFVTTTEGDELAFLATVERELDALGVQGRTICGRRQVIRLAGEDLAGFSLMIDGLSAGDSLAILEVGLGRHRRLGGGLFIPHRSAAALRA